MIDASRRRLIQRMGAWPLLWPVMRAGRAAAATAAPPRRVVIIFSPNGPIMERGPAVGTETNFTLNEFWAPLGRHKADGIFFNGLMQAGVPFGKHNEYGHQSGGTGALTARTTDGTNNGTGPSLDQFIGQALQQKGIVTPKRSLLWGLHKTVGNWGPWYEAAGKPTPVQNDPYRALADIVPGLPTGMAPGPGLVPDRRLARKHFVLDSIYKDCKELTAGLSAEGKTLLDFHCQNISSLEQSVAKSLSAAAGQGTAAAGPGCAPPARPNTKLEATANFGSAENYDEMMQAFSDLIPLAFTCDVTRVIGISFGGTAARFALPSKYMIPSAAKVDSGDSGPQHHAWTHTYNSSPEKRMALKTFYNWYSEQVALIVDKLKKTPDASGKPLLDSTLVLWTSELGHDTGRPLEPHPNGNIPVIMFGNGGGAFKTNRMYQGTSNSDSALTLHKLFVSAIQHTGLTDVNEFGNKGTGPLDWLKG